MENPEENVVPEVGRAVSMLAARRSSTAGDAQGASPDAGVRILCVDDHAVLVEGLRAHFKIDGHLSVVGRLPSVEGLVSEVTRLQPDIVLLDVEMPGPDVFEAADRLRQVFPNLRFIFLSAHVRDGYLAAAYNAGAWGYFAKGDDLSDITAGILEVAHSSGGTFVLGPKVRQRFSTVVVPSRSGAPRLPLSRSRARPTTSLEALSAREIDVLRLIGQGKSRNEIATELSRSVKTVDGHQDRIMRKLHIRSRSDLLRFAIREGLAEA